MDLSYKAKERGKSQTTGCSRYSLPSGTTALLHHKLKCHHGMYRGIFCEVSIIRYGTIDIYSALEIGTEIQPLLKSQGDPKSIYVHLYASININRYVFKLTCRDSN